MAESESPVVEATLLAISELNEAGGLLGRPVEPLVRDGARPSRRSSPGKPKSCSREDKRVHGVRLLDFGQPQNGRADLRTVRQPVGLPRAVRGARGVAQRDVPGRHAQPADHAGRANGRSRSWASGGSSWSARTMCFREPPTRSFATRWPRWMPKSSAKSTCRWAATTSSRSSRRSPAVQARRDSQHDQWQHQRAVLQGTSRGRHHARAGPHYLVQHRRAGTATAERRRNGRRLRRLELFPVHRFAGEP